MDRLASAPAVLSAEPKATWTSVIDAMDSGVAVFDPADRLLHCNSRMRDMFPALRAQLESGTPMVELFRAQYRSGVELLDAHLDEDSWVAAVVARWRDYGAVHERRAGPFWFRSVTNRTTSGWLVVVLTDITDIKRVAQQRDEAWFVTHAAIESIPDGFAVFDAEHRLVMANRAYSALLPGLAEQLAPGVAMPDLLRTLYHSSPGSEIGTQTEEEWVQAALERWVQGGRPYDRLQGDRWIRRSNTRMPNGYMVAMRSDVTEMHRLNQDLARALHAAESASRTKSEFLATVSHELRTPLNAVLGLLELTLTTELTPTQREDLGDVQSSAQHLLRLIDALLEHARMERGQATTVTSRALLRGELTRATAALAEKAAAKGLHWRLEIDPALEPLMQLDWERLAQVLQALVDNAIKFTESGEVRVLAARLPHQAAADGRPLWCVDVHDSGPGIEAEQQNKLFASFSQADMSLAREHGGLGLGLTTAAQTARLLGGRLDLVSSSTRGSHFRVVLPLTAVAHELGAEPQAQSGGDGLGAMRRRAPKQGPLRVLVVEDVPLNQKLMVKVLARLGHQAELADDGEEGVNRWAQGQFDVVLMDVQMPRMDGLAATRAIRQQEALRGVPADDRVPIIAVTAHALPEDRQRCLDSGMDGYMPKPVSVQALQNEMGRVLALR